MHNEDRNSSTLDDSAGETPACATKAETDGIYSAVLEVQEVLCAVAVCCDCVLWLCFDFICCGCILGRSVCCDCVL